MWGTGGIAVAVGVCLSSGALAYAARQPRGASSAARTRPVPQEMLERPCGAGMALAGVLGEPGML